MPFTVGLLRGMGGLAGVRGVEGGEEGSVAVTETRWMWPSVASRWMLTSRDVDTGGLRTEQGVPEGMFVELLLF